MEYRKCLSEYQGDDASAVTLGKFDGLHKGHQKLIRKIEELKKEYDIKTIVCAFDMRPLQEKMGKDFKGLMTKEEQYLFLKDRVDTLVQCPFTEEFSRISAEDFIRQVLSEQFHAKYIVVGTDFHFGYKKRGDVQMLQKYAEEYGYEVFVIDKERYEGQEISSTRIRSELCAGNLEATAAMLGYDYTICGTVEHGMRLGRELGFPTLNVHPLSEKLLPPKGVYGCRVNLEGDWYDGIGNLGYKPTVAKDERMLIETYLFQYSGDAYEKNVKIELQYYLRPEMKFESVKELTEQVRKDIEKAKKITLDRK